MSVFTGAGVALITPMKEDLSVNYEKLEELIEYQIANKTDAIIICGTTGEASTLTTQEHLDVIKSCVEITKKRVPVIAGTSSNCTKTAVSMTGEAEKYGADAVLVTSPYYNKATQNGLKAHFGAIAEGTKLPVVLYNIAGRTGVNIQPETVAGIFKEHENVVAIKEASGDIEQVTKIADLTDGGIDIYSGCDELIVPILSIGGKGVISVLSHVVPEDTHNIVEKYLSGDVEESRRLQLKYFRLIKALFSEVNPIPVKAALNLMGMNVGSLRQPLTEMEPEHKALLKTEMEKVGII